jgi:hypothetical protein
VTGVLFACVAGLFLGLLNITMRHGIARVADVNAGSAVIATIAFVLVAATALASGVDFDAGDVWPFVVCSGWRRCSRRLSRSANRGQPAVPSLPARRPAAMSTGTPVVPRPLVPLAASERLAASALPTSARRTAADAAAASALGWLIGTSRPLQPPEGSRAA